ncbi:MAG TPA: hypothetical protein VJ844_00720 [Mucilaginibacter sp.]|nr:hypothetical protein [Mucilaginibacter sp.]
MPGAIATRSTGQADQQNGGIDQLFSTGYFIDANSYLGKKQAINLG